MYTNFENLSTTERAVRFTISTVAIVAMLGSSLVGSALFAGACLLAIAVATTAIVGWDPVKTITFSANPLRKTVHTGNNHKHA